MNPAADQPPRVVIADDQTLVRGGFRLILKSAGIPVVAEASDGKEAVAAALKHRPDVMLMDIRMPEMDGLEATRRITSDEATASTRVLILTTFDLDEYVFDALLAAVRVIATGEALLAPKVTRRLIEQFVQRPPEASAAPHAGLQALTER